MIFRISRFFSRRKLKSYLIRFTFVILSLALVVVIFTKGKQGPNGHFLESDLRDASEEVLQSPSRLRRDDDSSVINTLSAIQKERFNSLNPVKEGWGDNGSPVILHDEDEMQLSRQQFSKGAFNVYISDRISPNRSLQDPRPPECSQINYGYDHLGTCSVVIIFTDEIWSALIRTIWSTWNRTPPSLLKEIILVDDASNKTELQNDLKVYCKYYFGDKVKLIRSNERIGLIRARMRGAEASTGDVLVFLDSHCEVTEGWLEPLMATIAEDSSNVVCPVIDVISDKNLEYNSGSPYFFQVGSFTWPGHFTWIDIPVEQLRNNPTKPVKSPTMAGGLFAIKRDYFFHIGAYDEAMEIWGGENLELSFRIWQCGGKLLIHPCSHVGHIFRDYHPYSFNGKDTHGLNTLRTVLVWMDPEYQKYFFMHRHDLRDQNPGDLSQRLALKKKLKCKSFKWYLANVFGSHNKKFIYDRDAQGWGWVKNRKSDLCLDTLNLNEEKSMPLGVYHCSERPENSFTNQFFTLTNSGELRREEGCATVDADSNEVKLDKCVFVENSLKTSRIYVLNEKKKQLWNHKKGGPIVNAATGDCLTTRNLGSMSKVIMEKCNPYDAHQKWWFQQYSSLTPSKIRSKLNKF